MEFRTTVEISSSKLKINHQSNILLIGSCFSDNIGQKLQLYKFPVLHNPFGVLYNPLSVKQAIEIILENKKFVAHNISFYNEKWFSFMHHSSFSHFDKQVCLKNINESLSKAANFLKKTNFLFVTFGTARVYRYKKTNKIVANCHKIPAHEFEHFLLEVDDIVEEYAKLIQQLKELNPGIYIYFTVSPIRHWKDGAFENQVSKSTLLVAVSKLLKLFPNTGYFPAYEFFMDELRDYRFYAPDMLHPSETGIEYIWQKFAETFFAPNTHKLNNKITKITTALNHKPFNPDSESHKKFVKKTTDLIQNLTKEYSYLDFSSEIKKLK